MRIGRRPLFFAALAVICLVMLEPTPAEYRWVNLFAAGLALFWAVMLFLEERSLVRWMSPRNGPAGRLPPGRRPSPRGNRRSRGAEHVVQACLRTTDSITFATFSSPSSASSKDSITSFQRRTSIAR